MSRVNDVSFFLIVLITTISCIPGVRGYYCNHDLCREDQYCCGDNLCCDYVYSLWYFWIGVVILVVMLSVCGGFFRYIYKGNSFIIVQTCKMDYYPSPDTDDEEKNLTSAVEDIDAPPPYPGLQCGYKKEYDRYSSAYEHTGNFRSSFQKQNNPNLLVHFN